MRPGRTVRAAVIVAAAILVVLVPLPLREAAAAPPLNCHTFTIAGGEMSVIADKSNWQDEGPDKYSLLCNYSGIAGAAITVEFMCPAGVEEAWQSRAANRSDAVIRTPTEVMEREDGGFTTFGGFYEYQEKAFLRPDAKTFITIVLYSNSQAYGSDIKGAANRIANAHRANARLAGCPDTTPPPSGPTASSTTMPPAPTTTTYVPPPTRPLTTLPTSSTTVATTTTSAMPERKLCDELKGVLGLSDEKIKNAGISDPEKVPIAYDAAALGQEIQDAIAEFQDRTGQAVFRDAKTPYGGTPGALTWLFSSGGVVDDISTHYVTGKENDLRGGIVDLSRARELRGESPLLTPKDVFALALERSGGDARQATLLAHNTLRSLGRAGDLGYTGVSPDPAFFGKHLVPLRPGNEQAGVWYHTFGTIYHGMLGQQQMEQNGNTYLMLDAASLALMLIPGGQPATIARILAGLARVTGALGAAANDAALLSNNSDVANFLEQLYREKVGGVPPDPVKFCMNVWGSEVGRILNRDLPRQGDGPAPYSTFKVPVPNNLRKTFKPVQDTSATKFVNISGSPFAVQWTDGDQSMVLDQGAGLGEADLLGSTPTAVVAIPEKDTWGAMWVAAADSKQTVTLEATRDGAELHLDRINIEDASIAMYRATATKKGDQFTIELDNTKIDPDLKAPDGSIVRPTIGSVAVGGNDTFAAPTPPSSVARVDDGSVAGFVWVLLGAVVVVLLGLAAVLILRRSKAPAAALVPAGGHAPGGAWAYVEAPVALYDADRARRGTLQPGAWYEVLREDAGWVEVRDQSGSTGWTGANELKRQT